MDVEKRDHENLTAFATANGNKTAWADSVEVPRFPKLKGDLQIDTCVIGGGVAGLTTAYLLLKEGRSVCILESLEIGAGQSGLTTAQFATALDDHYFEIERLHGINGARLAAHSHTSAIGKVEAIIAEEGIRCESERVDGYLFGDEQSSDEFLRRELEAVLRAGLPGVEWRAQAPLLSFNTGPCIRFPRQLQLQPLKYLAGLANACIERDGKIFCKTRAVSFKHEPKSENGREPRSVVTTEDGYKIVANNLVVATNTPINDMFAIHTKQSAYRTYVVGFRIPRGSVNGALFWDTGDPYHYIRIERDRTKEHDVLIVGGEDHKTGQDSHPLDRYDVLERWTRERFPMAEDVMYRWSGQVMEPVDGLAFLGRNPGEKNVFVISGDSGNGMTHATIGAVIITDLIVGRESPWAELYNPSRINIKAAATYMRENANVAAQYGDWLSLESPPDLDRLARGEAIVFRDGVTPVAAYRDEQGTLEMMSAVCPHLAGIVKWNAAEKSWDCPCHGSRFDCHGKVIEGPASTDLAAYRGLDDEPTAIEPVTPQDVVPAGLYPFFSFAKNGES